MAQIGFRRRPSVETARVEGPCSYNSRTMNVPVQYARAADGVQIAHLAVGQGTPIVFASNIFGDAFFYRRLPLQARGITDRKPRLARDPT